MHYYKEELSVAPIAILLSEESPHGAGKRFEPRTYLVGGRRSNNLGYATPLETYPWLIQLYHMYCMNFLGLLTFYTLLHFSSKL